MKNRSGVSRRQFLQTAGSLSGAAYLRLTGPALIAIVESACSAKQQASTYQVLGQAEAADFAAIAARIIPTTDTPGATEAGVIHFFDNAFAAEMSDQFEAAREGLAEFNTSLKGANASTGHFSELTEDEQDAYLAERDSSDFFNLVWIMTIFGFFSMSNYGGNKDHLSWDLIGFEGHHGGWQYPFGYYDAEYMEKNRDG